MMRVGFSSMAALLVFGSWVSAGMMHWGLAQTLVGRVRESGDVLVTSVVLGVLAVWVMRIGLERRPVSPWLALGLVPAASQVLATWTDAF